MCGEMVVVCVLIYGTVVCEVGLCSMLHVVVAGWSVCVPRACCGWGCRCRYQWGGAGGSAVLYVLHLCILGLCHCGYASVVMLEPWFVFVHLWV